MSRVQSVRNLMDTMEHEYDEVDKEVHNVHILPARPISEEQEYADRDVPRSSPTQSPSSAFSQRALPKCLPREIPPIKGPPINRNMKPGRRKRGKRAPPAEPEEPPQPSQRSSPHNTFMLEMSKDLAQLAVNEISRKSSHTTDRTESNSRLTDVPSMLPPQRRSLDLETHDFENRSHQHTEERPSKRHHHEWPRTKEEINQLDFVPAEKPNPYCEEDWYVGACNRTDAEHALHLFNKDGAFLVRDCSINTNSEPLVLVVYHEKKVYNVKIRFIQSAGKYALGTGQRSNDMFDSVAAIIRFHSIFPITLVSGRNVAASKCPENCVLVSPITKQDLQQLLQ